MQASPKVRFGSHRVDLEGQNIDFLRPLGVRLLKFSAGMHAFCYLFIYFFSLLQLIFKKKGGNHSKTEKN